VSQQRQQRRHSIVRNAVQPAVLQLLEQRRLLSASVVLDNLTNHNLATGDSTGVQQKPVVAFKGTTGVMAWTDDNASGGSGTDIVAADLTPRGLDQRPLPRQHDHRRQPGVACGCRGG
jgi:hypothetical protein